MQKFNSKVDLWLVLFSTIIFGVSAIKMVYDEKWTGLIIILCAIALIIHIFSTTYYIIEKEVLLVKCGFFIHIAIDIHTIKKITETNNILSSPALSLDRIEIFYNKYDNVMISPKDKAKFVEAIQKINPKVEIIKKS